MQSKKNVFLSLLLLVSYNICASEDVRQVLRRRRPTANTMSETTKNVLRNHNVHPESHPQDIKELAYHMSDEATDYGIGGAAASVCSGCIYWVRTDGCQVFPAMPELAMFSLAGLAGAACLFEACRKGCSARELFVLASKKRD